MSEKAFFPEGFYFNEPHPNAPDFVKGSVSVKVEEFKKYLSKVQGQYLNIDLKVSREGKPYAQVNTFKPEKKKAPADVSNIDNEDDGLPF